MGDPQEQPTTYVLRIVSSGKVLAAVAMAVIALLVTSAHSSGVASGWSLLAIGLFNSIIFPTIFSLALRGWDHAPRRARGSSAWPLLEGLSCHG